MRVGASDYSLYPPGNKAIRYFHYDANGNCILQTDSSGALMEQYSYDAFGYPYFHDGAPTSAPHPPATAFSSLAAKPSHMKVFACAGFFAVLCLFSCSSSHVAGHRAASLGARYRLRITDRPDQKRFEVALQSLDDRLLCVTVENWPNRQGRLHFGTTWVHVESLEGKFPGGEESFGYCIDENGGPCLIYIAPKSSLKGYIAYKEFGDPATIAALSQRRLHFTLAPRVCKSD